MTEDKKMKPFYAVGLHHVRITSFRYAFSEKKGTPFLEVNFDVIQRVNQTDNKVEEHEKVYNRPMTLFFAKGNFDYSIAKLNSLLQHCGIKEPFDDFEKLDPDSPSAYKIVGKIVPMWCSHNKETGYENWQPSTEPKGKKKEVGKNDSSAAQRLNDMFGPRLQNATALAQMDNQQDTSTQEEYQGVDDVSGQNEELPF